jgi:hypothetical protein
LPAGPLDALFDLHRQAVAIFRNLLAAPEQTWSDPFVLDFDWVPPEQRTVSRRKIAAARAVPQPAPLGATGDTGAQRRLPLQVQGRPAV